MPDENLTARIDMSLRLWSDQSPIKSIIEQLDLEIIDFHEVGRPMAKDGPLANKIATRHYASSARSMTDDDSDVAKWCSFIVATVASSKSLTEYLAKDEIEALLWIAIFEAGPSPFPRIPVDVIEQAEKLKLSILFESYAGDSDNKPEKLWLLDMRSKSD